MSYKLKKCRNLLKNYDLLSAVSTFWFYITNLLPRNADTRSATRASRYGMFNLVRPHYNRETERGRTFQVRWVKLWNAIPLDVRKKDTLKAFKTALTNFFLA